MTSSLLLVHTVVYILPAVSYSCYVYPPGSRDPCIDRRCSYGAECMPSLDGMSARCQCRQQCHQFGDSVDSVTLCASDGRHYSSVCHMKMSACREMRHIDIRYEAPCDPCAGFTSCLPTEVCQLDNNRRPVCRCHDNCDRQVQPVCGTDGRTYRNECHLQQQVCKYRQDVSLLHRGQCPLGVDNPCWTVVCDSLLYERCTIDTVTRQGHCVCLSQCERVVRPVCGSNGITYDSECHFQRSACQLRQRITIKYNGPCDDVSRCNDVVCNYGALCDVTSGDVTCRCQFDCMDYYDPVCGSDGMTYDNECVMKSVNCINEKNVTIHSRGICINRHNSINSCDSIKCDFYSFCLTDHINGARCVCPTDSCSQTVDSVCGSDGVNYDNECQLRMTSCNKQTTINIIIHGTCDQLCSESNCLYGGRCTNAEHGLPVCSCNFNCADYRSEVCGSDGNQYLNDCVMKLAACQQQTNIVAMPTSTCTANVNTCSRSEYGCCSDGHTSAQGPDQTGCPSLCLCNRLGSKGQDCDVITRQCRCKPGVTGLRCDRCLVNYWGLFHGHEGCTPCRCNVYGSERDDCEQTKGQCVCKPHVIGLKCNHCINGRQLTSYGCTGFCISKSRHS